MCGCLLLLIVWHPEPQHIPLVELNTYGPNGSTRAVLIYRDHQGRVMAWRWARPPLMPVRVGDRWVAIWRDTKVRSIQTSRYVKTRTLKDTERLERGAWPVRLRAGLR